MSNEGMRPQLPTLRVLILLGILLAPFVAVQVQERIFRYRAERLLADMRALIAWKASAGEVQAVFKSWTSDGNPCSDGGCMLEGDSWRPGFRIEQDVSPEEAVTNWQRVWLPPLFRTFGGRIAHVEANANLNGGIVRVVSFEADVEVSPSPGVNDYHAGNMLSGGAASGLTFSIREDWQGLTLHPEYVISGVKLNLPHESWAPSVYVAFGPHADPKDVQRLMAFDFSCLTRWRPCREPGDLMPEAAGQHAKEAFQLAQAGKDHVCGPDVVALMARDALYVGVVEVTGIHPEAYFKEGQVKIPTVRMIENFKPENYWKPGEYGDIDIYDVNTDRVSASLPSEVGIGSRFILLAQFEKYYGTIADPCGIVPLNPANVELVRQAIAGRLPSAKP